MISNLLLSCLLASSVCGIAASSSYERDASITHTEVQNSFTPSNVGWSVYKDNINNTSPISELTYCTNGTDFNTRFTQYLNDPFSQRSYDFGFIYSYLSSPGADTPISLLFAIDGNYSFSINLSPYEPMAYFYSTDDTDYRISRFMNPSLSAYGLDIAPYGIQVEFVQYDLQGTFCYSRLLQRRFNDSLSGSSFSQVYQYGTLSPADEFCVYIRFIDIVDNDFLSFYEQSIFNQGKEVGIEQGQRHTDFMSLINGMADIPFITLRGLFNFTIFGQNFYVILMSILTLLLVVFLIKWFITR